MNNLISRIAKVIQQQCINRNAGGSVECADGGIDFSTGWLDSELLEEALQKEFKNDPVLILDPEEISPREQEVLKWYAKGLWSKQIALKLGISNKTVNHHLAAVKKKIGMEHPVDLIRYAIQHGIIETL